MQIPQGNQLNELAEIAKTNLLHSQSIERRLGLTEMSLTQLMKDVGGHDTRLNEIETKVENLELNYEITDEQSKFITSRARERVIELIGYPSVYFRIFIGNCYSFLRANYHLGSTIGTTKKRNYDYVMDGIAAWHPDIDALKARKDKADTNDKKHELRITEQAKKEMAAEVK